MTDTVPDGERADRLIEISDRLESAAARLGAGDLEPDEATRLAGECADLASQAVAELDRLARSTPYDAGPAQEELL
jgi:hypothetical protein